LYLKRKDGRLVLLAPVDYVFWTKKLEDKINSLEKDLGNLPGTTGKELWISGRMDEGARAQFEQRGWKIQDDAENKLF